MTAIVKYYRKNHPTVYQLLLVESKKSLIRIVEEQASSISHFLQAIVKWDDNIGIYTANGDWKYKKLITTKNEYHESFKDYETD